jgi:hypothetical protein
MPIYSPLLARRRRAIGRLLGKPDSNMYAPCLTIRHYRQKHGIGVGMMATLATIETAKGQSLIELIKRGRFNPPIDQAWISNAESGSKYVNPKNQILLAAVVSQFEDREVTPDELFPEYRDQPGLIPQGEESGERMREIRVRLPIDLYTDFSAGCQFAESNQSQICEWLIRLWLKQIKGRAEKVNV